MQKTILITLSRGSLVRNILKTECIRMLEQENVRMIVMIPEGANRENIERISPSIICETLLDAPWSWLDVLLNGIFKSIGYNRHTRSNDLYGIFDFKESSLLKYWLRKLVFQPISRVNWIKHALRRIDAWLVYAGQYKTVFDRYNPSLVFATSIVGDTDIEVVKEAQRRGIPVVGMPKSWDNLPKVCLRVEPEILLLWGERSRYEAQTFSGMKKETIYIAGASQFDHYYRKELLQSREAFCKEWGLDPSKKIVLCGSEGKVMAHDGEVAAIIDAAIADGRIDAQLIIRPHFIYKGDSEKFDHIKSAHTIIDRQWNPDKGFRDSWDYSDEQIKRFTNMMHHMDVMVTSVSTLTVDACVNKKPVINYYFDGTHNIRYEKSMRRWYEREHYHHIVENQAASIAWDEDDMIRLINMYLENPRIKEAERARCAEYVGGPPDGKAGERMGQLLLDALKKG